MGAPRIYPSLPRSTPPLRDLVRCLLLPESTLPPGIPLFNKFISATLPESIPHSQNTPPFQQLYATLTETTPPSQNIPPFQQIYMCEPARIYPPRIYLPFKHLHATLPESTPPYQNMLPFSTTICDTPWIYPYLKAKVSAGTSANKKKCGMKHVYIQAY